MTKKRYPKTARRSRPNARRPYPFERRYEALRDDQLDSVAETIDRIPAIRRLDRTLLALSKEVQADVGHVDRYVAFEDRRLEQRIVRERAYFDAGHEMGRIEGASESSKASIRAHRDAASFARRVVAARLASTLTARQAVAVLLELTRGLVIGQRLGIR